MAAQLTKLLWRPGGSLTSAAGWRAARTALESTYPCLGISCDMVGWALLLTGQHCTLHCRWAAMWTRQADTSRTSSRARPGRPARSFQPAFFSHSYFL